MIKRRNFRCLKMKRTIRAKLHKKWAGLTTEQIQAAIKRGWRRRKRTWQVVAGDGDRKQE